MGGSLLNNQGLPDYVILSNGSNSWSVQIDGTIFFRKQSLKEIKEEYNKIISELEEEKNNIVLTNKGLVSKIESLINENNILKSELKKIKK